MCEEMCPQGVDLMDFVILLRRLSAKRGVPTHTSRMLENIKDTGHVVSIKEKHEEMRISLGLNPRPEGDYKKISDEIRTILKEAER
jgi:heterodisulfide reductase subunit C